MTEQPEVLPAVQPNEAEACIAAAIEVQNRHDDYQRARELSEMANKAFEEIHGPIYEKMRARNESEIFVIFDGKLWIISSGGAEPRPAFTVRDVPF